MPPTKNESSARQKSIQLKLRPALGIYSFGILIIYRVINAFLVQTFFVPDEYWQSVEVAHRLTFGYGYLTWEWREALRSSLHPLLFAGLFRLVAALRLDLAVGYTFSANLLQTVLCSIADAHFIRLTNKLFPSIAPGFANAAMLSVFCLLSNWFVFFCAPRTLANTMEMCLFTISLAYFPWGDLQRKPEQFSNLLNFTRFFVLMATGFVFRPTAVILYIPFLLWIFFALRTSIKTLLRVILLASFITLPIVGAMVLLDTWFYRNGLVFTPWNFLRFNVLEGGSALFGTHHKLWYITEGWWAVLTVSMPLTVAGLVLWIRNPSMPNVIPFTVLFATLVYSVQTHKEFRFLLPVVPLCCLLSGFAMAHVSGKPLKLIITLILAVNVPMMLYFGLVHQRGALDVMKVVRELCQPNALSSNNKAECSIIFLMPCHSTPLYSHLHINASIIFVQCEPHDRAAFGADESTRFVRDPALWVKQKENELASYLNAETKRVLVVMYDNFVEPLREFIARHRLTLCANVYHTQITQDEQGERILVYCSEAQRNDTNV